MVDVTKLIEEHKEKIKCKLMSVKEFKEEYNIGERKAYELTHIEGFPVIFMGKKAMIVRSKLDEWIIDNIGKIF